jgi:hypothetical protein
MITELERLLAHYGCDRFCYNSNDCDNCWFKQHVQYEMDRTRSQHPVCKSETKIKAIW